MITESEALVIKQSELVIRMHLILLCFMGVIFLWMAFAQLDVVSVAEGEVAPSSKIKYVQHLEGGLISKILIKAGDHVKSEQALFELEATGNRADVLEKKHQIKQLKARIATLNPRLSMIAEQVNISSGLLKDELTNRYNHLSLLREQESLKGQSQETKASLDGAKAAVIKLEDNLARSTLYSPVDGIIKKLNIFTIGGVVPAGGVLAEIVPIDDILVVEARLLPQDVGYIEQGQRAHIQLMSTDAMRLGKIKGEVVFISPDTLLSESGQPHYRVQIKTERSYFENGQQRYHLLPGMQVSASIVIGKRTVLNYLISPFIDTMDSALQER